MSQRGAGAPEEGFLDYIKRSVFSARLIKFGIVGTSGVAVNVGGLYFLTEFGQVPYFIASIIAIELSILSNFTINLLWTWRDRADQDSFRKKVIRYHIGAGATALLGNYFILIALTEFFGVHYMISNLIGIAVGTISNYLVNDLWTFKKRQ